MGNQHWLCFMRGWRARNERDKLWSKKPGDGLVIHVGDNLGMDKIGPWIPKCLEASWGCLL